MAITTSPTYGADALGLICGFQFGSDGCGVVVTAEQALQWLASASTETGFVWLHDELIGKETQMNPGKAAGRAAPAPSY